jgi:hypothetical protein
MGVPQQGQPQGDDAGTVLGQGVGSFIAGIRERSFRAKVGKMLAAGDCDGAARFALEKGRLELGSELRRTCLAASRPPAPPVAVASTSTLAQLLKQVADRAVTPTNYDGNTRVTRVAAEGDQLIVSARLKDTSLATSQWRWGVVRELCDPKGFGQLIQQGAVIRADFQDNLGNGFGSLTVDRTSCR